MLFAYCVEFDGTFYSQMSHREFLIRVSYMEIYNEEINDLLAVENQKLQIHESLEVGYWPPFESLDLHSLCKGIEITDFSSSARHICCWPQGGNRQ